LSIGSRVYGYAGGGLVSHILPIVGVCEELRDIGSGKHFGFAVSSDAGEIDFHNVFMA
jgi:hypothetical protein